MAFTPEDIEAVRACLEGIDRDVPVTVEPAAAKLLMPDTVRTVAEILAARRTASARRGTLAACCRGEDRADTLTAASEPLDRRVCPPNGPSGDRGIFLGPSQRVGSLDWFCLCPNALARRPELCARPRAACVSSSIESPRVPCNDACAGHSKVGHLRSGFWIVDVGIIVGIL
jgi:hypothetical protein